MRSRVLGSLVLCIALALLLSSCSHPSFESKAPASTTAEADGLALAVRVTPGQLQAGHTATATVTLRNDSGTAYRGVDGIAEVWYSQVRDAAGEKVSGVAPTHVSVTNMAFELDSGDASSGEATLRLEQPGEYTVQALYTSSNGHLVTQPVHVTVTS